MTLKDIGKDPVPCTATWRHRAGTGGGGAGRRLSPPAGELTPAPAHRVAKGCAPAARSPRPL